jgi:uncharacterized membrane protein
MENNRFKRIIGIIIISLILVCALVARLYYLNKYDLWYDELVSDYFSFQNISSLANRSGIPVFYILLAIIKMEMNFILYNFLVYFYSFFFGAGNSLRILSVIFSMFYLGIFYKFSRLFLNHRESIYALLIVAFNPAQIWHAQEATVYTTYYFLVVLMIYFYIKALKSDRLLYWGCFSTVSILAVYLNYYSILLLIVSAVIIFLENNRQYIKRYLLSISIVLISFLPLLVIFIHHVNIVKNSFWLPVPKLKSLLFTSAVFNLGYSATLSQHIAGLIIFFILFIYGVYSYYRIDKKNTITLILFLFLPIILVYIFSKILFPIYIDRQLLVCAPFYYLFMAKGVAGIKNRVYQISVLAVVLLIIGSALINYYRGFMLSSKDVNNFRSCNSSDFYIGVHPRKNYSDLMAGVFEELKVGDIVTATDIQSYVIFARALFKRGYTVENYKGYVFFYPQYLSNYEKNILGINRLLETMQLTEENELYGMFILPSREHKIEKIQLPNNKFKRIWVMSSIWDKEGSLGLNSLTVKEYILKNYKETISLEKDGIFLSLYTEKVPN